MKRKKKQVCPSLSPKKEEEIMFLYLFVNERKCSGVIFIYLRNKT